MTLFVCLSCDYSIIISTCHYLLWIQWFFKTLIFASPTFIITFRNILGCLRLTKYTQCTDRHLFSISRTASNEYQQPVRSLAGYSSWGCKEPDMTEWLRCTHTTSYHDKSVSHTGQIPHSLQTMEKQLLGSGEQLAALRILEVLYTVLHFSLWNSFCQFPYPMFLQKLYTF